MGQVLNSRTFGVFFVLSRNGYGSVQFPAILARARFGSNAGSVRIGADSGVVSSGYSPIGRLKKHVSGLVAVDDGIDVVPERPAGRMFLSDLAALVKAEKNMIGRNTREGVTRAQNNGVRCGCPRHSFPITRALKLVKQGLTVRAIAARIRFPVSTVGAALRLAKDDGKMTGKSRPTSAAGKPGKVVHDSRRRRTFPIYEASQLQERGMTIRAVAAEIDFPVSTVGAALKAHRLERARWLAARLERAARATLKRAKLKKADPVNDREPAQSMPDTEPGSIIRFFDIIPRGWSRG